MQRVNHYFHIVKNKTALKLAAITAITLGVVAIAGIVLPSGATAAGLPTNDPSNIINGGITSPSDLVNKYNANNPSDIRAIYTAFGLQSSSLNSFKSNAVAATLNKDGTLSINGKIVADGAYAVGRKGPQDGYKDTTLMQIGGKNYYTTPLSYILGFYNLPSTGAYVLSNSEKIQFVVMTACGNAVHVTQPQYTCNMLNSAKISDSTYQFNTNITATNGATLSKVVYDFGDGSAMVTENSASTVVKHTYDQPGTYTAKATAYFTYHGQTEVVTATSCQKQITIPKPQTPVYECSALNTDQITDTKFTFTAIAKVANGATLQNGDFAFGDGQTATNIVPTAANQIAVTHQYAKDGTYTITATLNFNIANTIKSADCTAQVTVKQQTTPVFECTGLTPIVISDKQYEFDATAKTAGGAILQNADFTFDDGQTANGIKPTASDQNKIVVTHTYTNTGTYTITATLNFNIAGNIKSASCTAQITINQPTPECKPGVPVGSPQCAPTPTVLPSTGPSDLFGSAIGLSSIVGASTHYIRTRRDLTAKMKRR